MRARRSGWWGAVGALGVAATALVGIPPAQAADPTGATVSPSSPTATWGGSFVVPAIVYPSGCDPNFCDVFNLTVDLAGGSGDLEIAVSQTGVLPFPGVLLRDATGEVVEEATAADQAVINAEDIAAGDYTVEVTNGDLGPGGTYTATATLTPGPPPFDPGTAPGDTVGFAYDTEAPVASATVPLRVVLVGFDEGSMTEEQVFSQIPDFQRVGSLYEYGGAFRSGDNGIPNITLINHGRSFYDEDEPFLLPLEYRWDPELVYAPSAFASGLFEHMVSASEMGDYADPLRRAFLEEYNAIRGTPARLAASGDSGRAVAPGAPVRFVDGESTEDWIAEYSEQLLGFEAGREPGDAGYTVFVLNTFDAPEAQAAFPGDEYHVFKINRIDPDRGEFDGIDWARVWGGRYRFMMLDVGAAPNRYEAETWGGQRANVFGSALHDPPIWEYRAGLPRPIDPTTAVQGFEGPETSVDPTNFLDDEDLALQIARTTNEAANFRFFHSYLYEPRPGTGRFFLSDNVWHDRTTIYKSDLELLYDQQAALNGLRTLTPYFEFEGDVRYQYLEEMGIYPEYGDDQAALDQAKADGDDIAGAPHVSMRTETMMDYIDAHPERFLRGGACATTVPTIQVVVPGHYAWALPVAAGIATNRAGVPWGFLNSVNDATVWGGADRDPSMTIAHPPVFSGTFTYTTIHEASHYLGLAHPHDTVGATRNEDGTPRYYDGFTWTFNTTAAPTTYSHAETTYSILDQESIARGHLAYYLQWTFEALQEAGDTSIANGADAIDELPAGAASDRALAIQRAGEAQALYADFRFVEATFAAQEAWRAAASYRDTVLALEPGTSQVARGTQTASDADLEAAGCNVAAAGTEPIPSYSPGAAPRALAVGSDGHAHSHAAPEAGTVGAAAAAPGSTALAGETVASRGPGGAPLAPLVLAAGLVLGTVARLSRRRVT